MKQNNSTTLYEIFSKYNAESEGDIDIILPKPGSPRPPLKYLKWIKGWQEVLKVDDAATYAPVLTPDSNIIWKVGNGGMVCVSVTIKGITRTEWYPIESMPMQPVKFENITPTQVNKAIKRALVKCLAQYGLAANLYTNDMLTEGEKDEMTVDIEQLISGAKTIDELNSIWIANVDFCSGSPKFVKMFGAKKKELEILNSKIKKTNEKASASAGQPAK